MVIRDVEVYVEPSDCLMQILQEETMLEDIMGILQDEYGYNEILECIDEVDIAAYCIESELKFVCSLPMMQESLKYIPPQEDLEFINAQPKYRYIFWNKDRQLTHRIIMYHMRPIYNDLFNQGLKKNDSKNRVCNHTLRHTFASHLAINQVPLFEIQKLLDHKDIKMTLRYMKLAEANKVSAVERLYKE